MIFYNFDQVGKGINPNTPKKEGLALYFDVFYREFWSILYLNILFLLACIPIFTISASWAAYSSVLIRMIRDVPVDVVPDFKRAFKNNFKQATQVFLLQIFTVFIVAVAFEFYIRVNPFFHIPLGVACVFLSLMNMYLIPTSVSVELPLKYVIKNSFFLIFLSLKTTILCGFILFLHFLMVLIMGLYSIGYFLLFGTVFLAYTTTFLTYQGIEKFCYQNNSNTDENPMKVEENIELSHEEEIALLDAELEMLNKEIEDES